MRRKSVPALILLAIALVAFPTLAGTLAAPVHAASGRGFHFVVNSGNAAPSASLSTEIIVIDGNGQFGLTDGSVGGKGSFTLVNNTTPVPKAILATGTWIATGFISYSEVGTAGSFASGTLKININLFNTNGTVTPAAMTIVCNIGFAGLSTGSDEGVTVVVRSTTFGPIGRGLTVFDVIQD